MAGPYGDCGDAGLYAGGPEMTWGPVSGPVDGAPETGEPPPAGAPVAYRAPSATTSSGCSATTGAIPSDSCSIVATSGIRLDPPTRNSPAIADGGTAASVSSDRVIATVWRSTGRARPSSCSRPSGTSLPSAGTMTTVPLARDSISFAVRTSSHSCRRVVASVHSVP